MLSRLTDSKKAPPRVQMTDGGVWVLLELKRGKYVAIGRSRRRFDGVASVAETYRRLVASVSGSGDFIGHRKRVYTLGGLQEDDVYRSFAAEFVADASSAARNCFRYAFLELLNNAIEHSGGTRVEVEILKSEQLMAFHVSDDGMGVFRKVADVAKLSDRRQAVIEIVKGKFTTDPSNHSGEGLFFTAKCADALTLEANGLRCSFTSGGARVATGECDIRRGTRASFQIGRGRRKTLKEVFNEYADASGDDGFHRTVIPVRVLGFGCSDTALVSRSEARRLVSRLETFKFVELDFSGVAEIGQGFADEVFRVFPARFPHVGLSRKNCAPGVEWMARRAESRRI
jgi:anti-sigma regulatory factor (Ser/Thr protein kinase)